MGNLFGGPALAAVDARAEQLPLEPLDRYWADIAVSWFDHAVATLHGWEDHPDRKGIGLVPFYNWRCDEDSTVSRPSVARMLPASAPTC